MKKVRLDLIIPIFYEQDNIEAALSLLKKNVKTPHRILLIYDLEKDPTIKIVKKLQKKYSNVHLVKNKYKRGVVNALKTGFEKARAEIIVTTMADLCDDPRDIDKMVKKIDRGYDIICASRYSKGGKRLKGPVIKGLLSYFANSSLHILTGIPSSDVTNAFKGYRASVLKKIKIESIGGFELPLEITVKGFSLGAKITEIPTIWREREQGTSKFKLLQWFPQYLKWYMYAILYKWFAVARPMGSGA